MLFQLKVKFKKMERSLTIGSGKPTAKTRLEPIMPELLFRANSAQPILQSHPCFQSSLFNDKERAAGSLKVWKERNEKPFGSKQNSEGFAKEHIKDYQLENIIWTESVNLKNKI